jgi:DNA methyltransferase 1-associated protein 1
MEYPDYPFAKFNVKCESVTYSPQEYSIVTSNDTLDNTKWDKKETDKIFDCVRKYGLRWPIVHDRVELSKSKTMEELKER